jgi:hypothetical protein
MNYAIGMKVSFGTLLGSNDGCGDEDGSTSSSWTKQSTK